MRFVHDFTSRSPTLLSACREGGVCDAVREGPSHPLGSAVRHRCRPLGRAHGRFVPYWRRRCFGCVSSAPTARYASLIRKFFEYTGRYEPSGGGAGKGFNFQFKCLLGCGTIVPQWGPNELDENGRLRLTNSTGRLSNWLQNKYWAVYEKYILGKSPYVRQRVIGGQIVKFYSFREAATCHILYVLMCARDCRSVCDFVSRTHVHNSHGSQLAWHLSPAMPQAIFHGQV